MSSFLTPKRVGVLVAALVVFLLVIVFSNQVVETNEAGNVQIRQMIVSGTLDCKLESGMWGQYFSSIHTYKEAETFHFNTDADSLPTRFADATKAQVSGTVRVLLPVTDCAALTLIHRKFKSFAGLMDKLVEPAMRKALFHSGPHMTAAESYAERRGEFASLAEDQLMNGVIKVDKVQEKTVDPITGQATTITKARPRECKEENGTTCVNGFERDIGVFREFNISLTNFVIDGIKYPKKVLAQIETQRSARMNIITKKAEAQEADARAQKAEAEARAKVAETRAEEEVQKTQRVVRAEADKAEAVLQAEKVKEVAKLEKEAAEFEKKRQILLGEGEATRKRLVMQADGALEKKLEALVKINARYADALSKAQPGALVPALQMGASGGGNGGALDLVNLLTAKAAKDLSTDLGVKRK